MIIGIHSTSWPQRNQNIQDIGVPSYREDLETAKAVPGRVSSVGYISKPMAD